MLRDGVIGVGDVHVVRIYIYECDRTNSTKTESAFLVRLLAIVIECIYIPHILSHMQVEMQHSDFSWSPLPLDVEHYCN